MSYELAEHQAVEASKELLDAMLALGLRDENVPAAIAVISEALATAFRAGQIRAWHEIQKGLAKEG